MRQDNMQEPETASEVGAALAGVVEVTQALKPTELDAFLKAFNAAITPNGGQHER